jgi:formyltetrahydrofolate synthetase
VVVVNRFSGDTDQELELITRRALEMGAFRAVISEVHARGGAGGADFARAVMDAASEPSSFQHLYPLSMPIREKIEILAREIYGAERVKFYDEAERKMQRLTERGYADLPVCMAKTQYSLSHDPDLKNRPKGYVFTVRSLNVSVGAGFLVPVAGDIMLMPGMPAQPALRGMDLTGEGEVKGLF